ncbi:2-haloacrylate reductase-like [Salvia splendens]|uniref:2-haloacrylate reductase-like n=1 Tax=Salvia splendens TaxID=180675 RepID=UPI00110198F5|nr:2-haloacrylate reductase-like [Salvia splendens]
MFISPTRVLINSVTHRQVERGHSVLVHAAAGGTGSLLCQWANSLGATVIGTVSTEDKAVQAKDNGCHHVILYTQQDFVSRVTCGRGVEVVNDLVGRDTFQGSLEVGGYMVRSAVAAKCVLLRRPYNASRDEVVEAASEVKFTNVEKGIPRVRVNHSYPFFRSPREENISFHCSNTR